MKTSLKKNDAHKILGFALICFVLHSCTTNRIFTENDIVYSTQRTEYKYNVRVKERRSPVIFMSQSFIKETGPGNETTYKAYDVLYLTSSAFRLDEKVFFIIDNEVYPMAVDRIELDNTRSITENTSSVSSSDSTTVSVVTGYSEDNSRITRFRYKIPMPIMEKIKASSQFSLRYYSGPSMITVTPKQKSIRKIRELI